MRHLFFWIVTVPIVIVLVTFTVMNTQDVTLDLWPFPWEAPIPAYGLIFGCLLVGFACGLIVMWRHGAPNRRHRRDLMRQVDIQASELDKLRRNTNLSPTASGSPSLVLAKPGLAKSASNALVPPTI